MYSTIITPVKVQKTILQRKKNLWWTLVQAHSRDAVIRPDEQGTNVAISKTQQTA